MFSKTSQSPIWRITWLDHSSEVLANRPDAQRPQGFSGKDAKALHQRQALRRILKGIQNGSYLTSKDDKVGWLKSDGGWLEILDWIDIRS